MVVCTGRGNDGDHCCWIAGEICEFLFTDRGGTPRCSVWGEWDTDKYRNSPVGRSLAEHHPGYTCQDWPQNIPEVMAVPSGPFALCCWGRGNRGDLG